MTRPVRASLYSRLASATGLLVMVAALVTGARAVNAILRIPAHQSDPMHPLTDLAPRSIPPLVDVQGAPLARGALPAGAAAVKLPAPPTILPTTMPDPMHPPQWTTPRAIPGPPNPPDPQVPPPMRVDPERGHHTNTE